MKNRGDHLNVLYLVFYELSHDVISFFTIIQFYSNIDEKRVGKSPQEISTRPTFRNILTLKKQDKTKMELPLDMVSISASSCRTMAYVFE